MTHTWKIGDWCETQVKNRALVVEVQGNAIRVCMKHEIVGTPWIDSAVLKPLPDCDSWTWQPPSPPDPGEGYRAIDPAVDVPEYGDEIWSTANRCWRERSTTFCRTLYRNDTHYRRKLPPTYAPFTAETFKPHRDRWIRLKSNSKFIHRCHTCQIDGVTLGYTQWDWETLLKHAVFDDTNTPCGVPQ